jgi:hypothetical protein
MVDKKILNKVLTDNMISLKNRVDYSFQLFKNTNKF